MASKPVTASALTTSDAFLPNRICLIGFSSFLPVSVRGIAGTSSIEEPQEHDCDEKARGDEGQQRARLGMLFGIADALGELLSGDATGEGCHRADRGNGDHDGAEADRESTREAHDDGTQGRQGQQHHRRMDHEHVGRQAEDRVRHGPRLRPLATVSA